MNGVARKLSRSEAVELPRAELRRTHMASGLAPIGAFRMRCANCPQNAACLPAGLGAEELAWVDAAVEQGGARQKGDHIYREGDEFLALYVVRAGSIASYSASVNGFEQITGFSFPGSLIGMDGIALGTHRTSAVALETSAVCRIPYESIRNLGQRIPALLHHVFQRLSQEIASDQQLLSKLGKCSAEQRVASLLLDISRDLQRRHLSATRFDLPMTRRDIGNYLGLSTESVSRAMTQMHRDGLLRIDAREVMIRDMDRLRILANGFAVGVES